MWQMMTAVQKKQMKAALMGVVDSLSFKQDGTIVAKRGYFYRNGMDTAKMEQAVLSRVPGATILSSDDKWRAWPKDSCFEVVFGIR